MPTKNNMIRLKSFTGDTWYNISLDRRTCDCPAFRMMPGPPCKHLNALGIYSERKPWRKSSVKEANSWVPGVSPATRKQREPDHVRDELPTIRPEPNPPLSLIKQQP
jgi:hypothetical protein